MKYLRGTFTLPAANTKTTGVNWDLAFLTRDEFIEKYKMTPEEYMAGRNKAQ